MPEKLDMETREQLFRLSVSQFISEYDKKQLEEFSEYWTEPNRSQTKMKWELEKTWDLNRRIKRWFNNQKNWNGQRTFATIKSISHGPKNDGAYELLSSIKKDFGING